MDLNMFLQLLLGGGPLQGAGDMPISGDLAAGGWDDSALLATRQNNQLMQLLVSMMSPGAGFEQQSPTRLAYPYVRTPTPYPDTLGAKDRDQPRPRFAGGERPMVPFEGGSPTGFASPYYWDTLDRQPNPRARIGVGTA